MKGRIAVLGLGIAAAGLIALAAVSSIVTHATGSFSVPDPIGDTLGGVKPQGNGPAPGIPDIVKVSGSSAGGNFTLTVAFVDPIEPPAPPSANGPAGRNFSGIVGGEPNVVVGFIDFDLDQDAGTVGEFGPGLDAAGGGGPGFTSNVTTFCPDPSGMGIEAFLSVAGFDGATAPLLSDAPPVDVPMTFDTNSFTATIPLSALGGGKNFNFGMVLGNESEPTDCAPGDGGFIKPSQLKPTPTATETEQPTATGTPVATETPEATVGVVVALPETGTGTPGSSGDALVLWSLLGAAAISAAAAGAWTLRRRPA